MTLVRIYVIPEGEPGPFLGPPGREKYLRGGTLITYVQHPVSFPNSSEGEGSARDSIRLMYNPESAGERLAARDGWYERADVYNGGVPQDPLLEEREGTVRVKHLECILLVSG